MTIKKPPLLALSMAAISATSLTLGFQLGRRSTGWMQWFGVLLPLLLLAFQSALLISLRRFRKDAAEFLKRRAELERTGMLLLEVPVPRSVFEALEAGGRITIDLSKDSGGQQHTWIQ